LRAGLSWPLPDDLEDARLEVLPYPARPLAIEIPLPDFTHVQRELSRRGVTRFLLWQEYKEQHPEELQYTAFCVQYRKFGSTTSQSSTPTTPCLTGTSHNESMCASPHAWSRSS
jgi:transposase